LKARKLLKSASLGKQMTGDFLLGRI